MKTDHSRRSYIRNDRIVRCRSLLLYTAVCAVVHKNRTLPLEFITLECVLFIAFMFYIVYSCHVSTVLGHITVFMDNGHLSMQEFLPWCSSSMSEINRI